MTNIIIETKRLYLREMRRSDYSDLCKILQDDEVMYAYEGAFSDAETQEWLDKQLKNYEAYGFGLWAVILKETDAMIGQCGLSMQKFNDKEVLEIGYLFQKAYWRKGYASEAAAACKKYAFSRLNAEEVFSIIRDTNIASQNTAKRVGMTLTDSFIKRYRGVNMPHYAYSVKKGASCMNVINLRENPQMKELAITYFQSKWASEQSMPVYEDCISRSLAADSTLPIWYLLMDGDEIIGCAGLITNDFISCMDLWPWLCALYIEEEHRGNAYGKALINRIKQDAAKSGFSAVYLATDHIGYYEKYGFEYLCAGWHPWGGSSRVYVCGL